MDTDIYIEEKTGGRSMRIPWIPESITFDSNGTRFAKYEILKVGEVYIPSGANIHSYAWKSLLPGEGRRDDILQRGEWQDPLWYQQIWSAWREYGTPLHLLVTGTPINHDVYLDDYSVDDTACSADKRHICQYRECSRCTGSPRPDYTFGNRKQPENLHGDRQRHPVGDRAAVPRRRCPVGYHLQCQPRGDRERGKAARALFQRPGTLDLCRDKADDPEMKKPPFVRTAWTVGATELFRPFIDL